MRKYLKYILIFIFLTISLLSLSLYIRKRIDKEEAIQDEVLGLTDYSAYPYVLNIPPTKATVGKLYEFTVSVVDRDTPSEEIKIRLLTSPSWMSISGHKIYGTPAESDLGDTKVSYELDDGTHKTFKTFYLVVENPNEEN